MKYKLIKEYPGSFKLGTKVEYESGYYIIKNVGNTICRKQVENYPEFWEKVDDKNYEILSWLDIEDNFLFKISDGEKYNPKTNDLIISVKRLSDGEVFSVGDNTNFGKIKSFDIATYDWLNKKFLGYFLFKNVGKLFVSFEKISPNLSWDSQHLCNVEKVKIKTMITKVVKINSEGIEFENNYKLHSYHESDCCEEHYLDFSDLTLKDFENLEFDLSSDRFFNEIKDYGIELIPIKGHSVRVPGYGYNNGYYSSQLDLILTNGKNTKTFDISKCQVIYD